MRAKREKKEEKEEELRGWGSSLTLSNDWIRSSLPPAASGYEWKPSVCRQESASHHNSTLIYENNEICTADSQKDHRGGFILIHLSSLRITHHLWHANVAVFLLFFFFYRHTKAYL